MVYNSKIGIINTPQKNVLFKYKFNGCWIWIIDQYLLTILAYTPITDITVKMHIIFRQLYSFGRVYTVQQSYFIASFINLLQIGNRWLTTNSGLNNQTTCFATGPAFQSWVSKDQSQSMFYKLVLIKQIQNLFKTCTSL